MGRECQSSFPRTTARSTWRRHSTACEPSHSRPGSWSFSTMGPPTEPSMLRRSTPRPTSGSRSFPAPTVVWRQPATVASNRPIGARTTSIFLDSDDRWERDALTSLLAVLEHERECVSVYGQLHCIDEEGRSDPRRRHAASRCGRDDSWKGSRLVPVPPGRTPDVRRARRAQLGDDARSPSHPPDRRRGGRRLRSGH